jgi:hypothetical protein
MKPLRRHEVRQFYPDRKDTHWGSGSWQGSLTATATS